LAKWFAWPTKGRQAPSFLAEQHRRELVQIIPPVDPSVPTGAFAVHDVETVSFQHVDGGVGGFDEEVFLAAAEPDEVEAILEGGVVDGELGELVPTWRWRPF
jgi:hypothetical protein